MSSKFLIADDSAFMRATIKNTLTNLGYTDFVEAENGSKAIELYKSNKPDITLLDLIMPEMDGHNALQKILEMDNNAKVLMITAVGQENMINECKKSGAKGYVVKPFSESQIQEAINDITVASKIVSRWENNHINLTPEEMDAIQEILLIEINKGITALSRLAESPVELKIPIGNAISWFKASELFEEKNKNVVTVRLASQKYPDSPIFLVFPLESALLLSDILLKREPGTSKELTDIDRSAIVETGNIVISHCYSALSDLFGDDFIPTPPYLLESSVGKMIEDLIEKLGEKAHQTLVTKVEFYFGEKRITGNLVFSCSPEQINQMLKFIELRLQIRSK